jgi:hypothetical protein
MWVSVENLHHAINITCRLGKQSVGCGIGAFLKASRGLWVERYAHQHAKNAYRPPNKDHTEEPSDIDITERIPWGPGAISPGRGFQRVAIGPLGLRSSRVAREYSPARRMAHPTFSPKETHASQYAQNVYLASSALACFQQPFIKKVRPSTSVEERTFKQESLRYRRKQLLGGSHNPLCAYHCFDVGKRSIRIRSNLPRPIDLAEPGASAQQAQPHGIRCAAHRCSQFLSRVPFAIA